MNILTLTQAANVLQQGKLIAYPTEAVYGLGCDPANTEAVEQIKHIKKRAPNMGFIVIAAHWEQVAAWVAPLPEKKLQHVLDSRPAHITWVFPANVSAPNNVCDTDSHTIAIRLTAHPVARAICKSFGAIVSTSANLHQQPTATSHSQIDCLFGPAIAGIVDGDLGQENKPSEIRDALTGHLIRGK